MFTNSRSEPSGRSTNVFAFCINMDSHLEKWIRAKPLLESYGFVVERMSGIVGNDLDTNEKLNSVGVSNFSQYLINNPEYRSMHEQLSTRGGVGCYISHLKCWQTIVDRNLDGAFIFEDDVDIYDKEFKKYFTTDIPYETDIVMWGYQERQLRIKCKLEEKQKNDTEHPLLKKCDLFFGTHFYYITRRGCEIMLKQALPIEVQIDSYISFMGYLGKVNILFAKQSVAGQNNITGTIIQLSDCWKCHLTEPSLIYRWILLLSLVILFILTVLRTKYSHIRS